MEKTCNRCSQVRTLEGFPKDKSRQDGRQGVCNICCNIRRKELKAGNPELTKAKRKAYYEKSKHIVLAANSASRARNRTKLLANKIDYYNKVKTDPAWQAKQKELRQKNKTKKKAYDVAYAQENREMISKRALAWSKNNPEKRSSIHKAYSARRRSIEKVGEPTKLIHEWEMRQKKVCYWCGIACKDDYHLDHYMPLSKGGKHEIANLVIACPPCNLTKNAKDPYVFAQQAGRLF